MRALLRKMLSATLPVDYRARDAGRTLYLTFDDGPTAHTPLVLEVLARHQVPATFFVVGKRIQGNEAILKSVHDAGHLLGNHSFSHISARKLRYRELRDDMDRCTETIRAVVPGWQSRLYRPPYGDISLGFLRLAMTRRARIMMWNKDSIDYRAKSAAAIRSRLEPLESGDILLFHDEFGVTRETLETLIPQCLERGFQFALP